MADADALYPPNPADVPPDLTRPPASYRTRVVVVLLSLAVFVAAYLGLTVGSAYLCYWCFAALVTDRPAAPPPPGPAARTRTGRPPASTPSRRDGKPVRLLVIGGVGSGLLGLFLVKGLFKRPRANAGIRVEVAEADQPALFAFIRRLCRDTKAPSPRHVYLVPDVNAAVAFDESFLNLVFPSRKNLIVGLGLVNRLDLAEFKAVLAHEFGHFSQSSMRLGRYVYLANRVIGYVVYGRDWLDDLLVNVRRADPRLALVVGPFSILLWALRKGLEKLFEATNFANAALSREMEYHADLVAVSVSGSDALVTALARTPFAAEALDHAWGDLRTAADRGRFTRDVYYHQTTAAAYLKAKRNDPSLGEVPLRSESMPVFKPGDAPPGGMWATHPADHLREANAKRRYVRGPADPRPAWALFDDPMAAREAVTRAVYQGHELNPPAGLEDPAAVQEFIDAEHAGTTYDAKYHGLYDNRYVRPGEPDELLALEDAEFGDPARLADVHARLYDRDDLKERMDGHRARQEEEAKLAGIAGGAVVPATGGIDHRGTRYKLTDAPKLLKRVREEIDKDFEWMHLHDRQVFRVHRAMAGQVGGADRGELEARYRFHLAAQQVHRELSGWRNHADQVLGQIAGQRQVESGRFQEALGALRGAREALREQLTAADDLLLPELTNMPAGGRLGDYLLPGKLVRDLPASATSLDGQWIGALFGQYAEVLDRLARVLFKSLGAILAVQERAAARWAAARDPAVASTPAADAGGPESPPT